MDKFNFIDVEQNTDEWFGLRGGKLTSSKMGCIMANFGKAFGEPAKKYAVNVAIEQITGNPIPSAYSNEHMERGHEQEPIARQLYERQNMIKVSNGGFFESKDKFIGCSPDGLVGTVGVIEIKSVIASTHYASVKRGTVDPAYKWQCIANLKFTGRDWMDFISYCAEFPVDNQLFIYRMNKDDYVKEFDMIDERTEKFKTLVNECKLVINGAIK
jgi:putative phage-type endonuclease